MNPETMRRLTQAHPRLIPVHCPVHASWLNQIDIYFSIVQCKALTPNDFPCLQAVAERLEGFDRYDESIAHLKASPIRSSGSSPAPI